MRRLRDWSDDYDAMQHFIEYFEEYCSDCYVTTDGKTITFTWCNLDDEDFEKSICTLNPKTKKATLIPSSGNEYIEEDMDGMKKITFGFLEELIDIIKQECINWKGEHDGKPMPFPKLNEKAKPKQKIELPSITVERNDKSKPDINDFYSYRYYSKDKEWVIHAPNEKELFIRLDGDKFKMFFHSYEETIATACKIILKRMLIDKAAFTDENYAFKLPEVKQTVYLYEKQKQGGNADSYNCKVYDPTSHGKILAEAISSGNTDFVRLCVENGANPVEVIQIKKNLSVHPIRKAVEENKPEILKILIEHAFNYYNNSRMGDGSPLSILSSIATSDTLFDSYQIVEKQIQMMLDCGYDCAKDAESIITFAPQYNISTRFTQMLLNKVKAGIPGIRRVFQKGGLFWKIDTIQHFLQTTHGKIGTFGQIQMELYKNKNYKPDTEACEKAAEKMIAKKLKEGYIEVQESAIQRNDTAENLKQRYFNSDTKKPVDYTKSAVDDLIDRLTWNSTHKELILDFKKYCDKNYKECFVTAEDGTSFAYHFCNFDTNTLDIKGDTNILKVDMKNKKLSFILSASNTDTRLKLKGKNEIPINDISAVEITLKRNYMKWTGEENGNVLSYNETIGEL